MVYSPRKVFYVVLTKYVLPERMPLYILPCPYDCSSNMKDILTDNKLEVKEEKERPWENSRVPSHCVYDDGDTGRAEREGDN